MMLLEEIMAEEGFNLSPHNHAFINPYDGCSMGCPFCYWLSREGWEGRIQVKMNIGNLLEEELRRWPKREFLYLGSVCDPFNELEGRYRLTKRCLEIIKKYEVPLVITSSAVNPVILDYVELLRSMKQRVVVVVELARIPYIEAAKTGGRACRDYPCEPALQGGTGSVGDACPAFAGDHGSGAGA